METKWLKFLRPGAGERAYSLIHVSREFSKRKALLFGRIFSRDCENSIEQVIRSDPEQNTF